jgi:Intermediate filament tail domain.
MYNKDMEQLSEELSFENEFHKERIGFTRSRALILVAVLIVLAAAGAAIALLLPKSSGLPVFSEVMTSNREAYLHPVYGSVDWIEIHNPTDRDVDLSGYGLSAEIKHPFRYTFPDGTILKAGEYLVLYCTGGTDASDSDPFCTGFNLSASGELLFLVTPAKVEADEISVPALETDTSYARTDADEFAVTHLPTPGEANRFE